MISTKRSTPASAAAVARVQRAERVVLQRRPGVVLLHQRHVLVGRGMEDELRPLGCERARAGARRSLTSPIRRTSGSSGCARPAPARRGRARIRSARAARAAPAGSARPGGTAREPIDAAGAGDEHRLAARAARAMPASSSCDRLAAEQVLGLDAAHALDRARCRRCSSLDRRHRQHRQTGRRRQLDRAPALRAAARPACATITCVAPRDAPRRRCTSASGAEHRHAADARVALGGVVVEQAEHDPALRGGCRRAAAWRPRRRRARCARRTSSSLPVMRARACS